ncbi:IS607 family element RNA-guided endonuclease TnpB [Thermaerobacter composti]|uniref:IS607 family element RNA-guided endonuclease TnpB n=1 Tax=Thermaerobacter composti TaxID=554949 RepID=A0ABZ0QR93_9FIRM|nr:IS607 family element RNA-guided endonuclease TnpB [Thermaerobacter composti]WPD20022.1 IS607 family element RNA-guided endonuclease TnpB [Thermaerobacter composti]
MRVLQAYRFALDPTPRQERALASHVGARRFAFNWGLALVKERLEARARGEEVEVPWTLPALRREWNRQKHVVAPWWRENSKEAYSSGLDGLARALQNWSKSRQGERKGRRVGFPRFRKKGRGRESVRFTTGAIRVDDKSHVVLPRIGRVKTHEPTTALRRRIEAGTARILSATVAQEGGRWFVSFTCEVERPPGRPRFPWKVVGVDAGVQHLAVLSTGEKWPNPRSLEKALRKIARSSRALARRQRGSRGWHKARRRLARLHARARNLRQDALHKLTHHLASTYGVVVVEQLHVAGMMKNRRLARVLADSALAAIRRQLRYKCPWHGAVLVEAPPFYPSSKRCSRCGSVKPSLPLSQRTFRCEECGLVLDRDENAARNLAALVAAVAGSGPETQNARGRDGRPAARQAIPEEAGSRRRLIAG